MRPLAVACYVLAVLGLALSVQVGWAAAVVSCVALAVLAVLAWLDSASTRVAADNADLLADTRALAEKASDDAKKAMAHVLATLEQMKRNRGGL